MPSYIPCLGVLCILVIVVFFLLFTTNKDKINWCTISIKILKLLELSILIEMRKDQLYPIHAHRPAPRPSLANPSCKSGDRQTDRGLAEEERGDGVHRQKR
jgi:hypothetical protein